MSKNLFSIFVWSLALLFYFYEFFLQIFLGTIATDVISSLGLTIEQFSILGAAFYLTYSLMQTPVGILTDKFGPRKILTLASFSCTFGVFWFSVSNGFLSAIMSRLLIGFGSSFGFVAILILALNWFDRKHFSTLCGMAQFLGAIGPILAGAPLAMLNHNLDGNWRLILFWIGVFGTCLTVIIFLFLRDKPKGKKNAIFFLTPHVSLKKNITELLKSSQVWAIMLYCATVYVAMPLLGAYWGVTYLQTRGFEKTKAAFIISMIWIGFSISAATMGKLSEKMKKRKPLLILSGLFGVIFSSLILYLPIENELLLISLFGCLGFCAAVQSLGFAMISEHVPKRLHSPALGLNNTAIVFFAAIIPPFASSIIQSTSDELTSASFTRGLSIIPVMFGLSFLIALFGIKETYCHQQGEMHKIILS